jgi:LuxR family maltose regulon positive regulatory protein
MQGDLDGAIRWSSRVIPIGVGKNESILTRYSSDLFHLTELEQLTLAKVFLSQNKPDKAVNLLRTLYCESEQRGRKISMVENLMLQAISYQELGKPTEALIIFTTSLKMAEPFGYFRVFLNAGAPVKSILTNLMTNFGENQNIEINQDSFLKPYIHDLLLAFDREPSNTQMTKIVLTKPKQDENLSWIIEPLSKRECEVVVLLSKGCSNKDIAQNLMISSGTVHKHLNNIFSKLGVHNRTSAVARARDLGYL